MRQKILEFIKKETVFCIAAVLACLSSAVVRPDREYAAYLDFRTLALLFCLMAIVAGMQSIGVFTALGQRLLAGTRGTRKLSFILVFLCFFSSMAGNQEEPRFFARRLSVYLILFLLNLLVVVHLLPWQAAFILTLLYLCLFDRKLLGELDYVLLLTFVCFFIFIGNMKRIEGISRSLSELIGGHELFTGIAASQLISNVPAAILLSGFTDRYQTLLTAVNLGGLGTLIASLASLISYKFFVRSYDGRKGEYVREFTKWNLGFLVILTSAAWLISHM